MASGCFCGGGELAELAAGRNREVFEANNARFASAFRAGHLPLPPKRRALVLACMDARLHPEKVLGLDIGDCHCVRNAGGRASPDALRSIAISQRLLGTTEVYIIHHTDCGMLTFTDDSIRVKIRSELGDAAGRAAEAIDFLPFPDLAQSVRDDVRAVREAAIVDPKTPVQGYIYDVRTGKLEPVAA